MWRVAAEENVPRTQPAHVRIQFFFSKRLGFLGFVKTFAVHINKRHALTVSASYLQFEGRWRIKIEKSKMK